jgi:multidrug efflux system membrane fusion protein
MSRQFSPLLRCLCLVSAGLLAGCGQTTGPAESPELPVVPVSRPVPRDVTDYVDYTGRTAAVYPVDIRARVSGYLVRVAFKEGLEVKEGDLLYEIDPQPYQAQFDAASAQVSLNEAALRLARANYARAYREYTRNPGSISAEQIDTYRAQEAQAVANVGVAQANLKTAKLNLGWTRVTSPISGQVGRTYYTAGNLVNQDVTLLTTVVSVDPMYAYFDMDERTILRVRTAINEGRIIVPKNREDIPILMGLENETGYPHQGTFNFVNNTVNPQTGTISVRGLFANPHRPVLPYVVAHVAGAGGLASLNAVAPGALLQPVVASGAALIDTSAVPSLPGGRRLLSPGMFVRIRVPLGQPRPALLVADRAVGSDQGLKFVYVVDAEHKVRYRRVSTGPLQDDGLRVIEEGLGYDDRVVVGALQQVRPGMEVEPEEMAMPAPGTPAGGQAPSPVSGKPQPPPSGAGARGQ